MPRGFTACIYVDDHGTLWRLMVDADQALQTDRGWDEVGDSDLPPLPRGWLPRIVVGIDDTGRQCRARVGRTDAALWTGASTTFDVEANDGTTVTAQVTTYLQEKRIGPHTDPF